ncbi:hypothetical protein RhiJN_13012 [Ceratobasidium sp. AG-Ba]|nr:hypothetical protein RhiJN_13012 [Ceratobasidium sp. AG-Ba]
MSAAEDDNSVAAEGAGGTKSASMRRGCAANTWTSRGNHTECARAMFAVAATVAGSRNDCDSMYALVVARFGIRGKGAQALICVSGAYWLFGLEKHDILGPDYDVDSHEQWDESTMTTALVSSALSGSIWSIEEGGYVRRAAAEEHEVAAFSSHEHPESAHHLVIPSLALGPALVSGPTPAPEMENAYGEALGNVRLLVLGGQRSLADNLLMRTPNVVHIHGWDQPTGDVLASLEASTILADRERNVRLTVMPPFDACDNDPVVTRRAVQQVLRVLHESFHTLHSQLHPARAPGPDFQAMLASHRTPLVTAVVVVVSEPREHDIISAIAAHAPVITLPSHRRRHHPRQSQTRSSSQNGLDSSQHAIPPPLSRHSTQRPTASILQSPQVAHMLSAQYPHTDRGRQPGVVPLRGSRQTVSAHASPPFAYSMPVSATASPFPPPSPDREYVLHLNSMGELAYVLFHSPRALASLRDAAAARFVAWREREREISEDRTVESRAGLRESRMVGFLGFEDVDAGPSEREDDEEQEDMVMRTMWSWVGRGTRRWARFVTPPTVLSIQSREPLPLFNAPSSVAETASSGRPSSVSPSPIPMRRRRLEPQYGEGSGTPLARSVYHDPLHLPSLLALAASVLPRAIGGLFGARTRTGNECQGRG